MKHEGIAILIKQVVLRTQARVFEGRTSAAFNWYVCLVVEDYWLELSISFMKK